ncbi:hypothetical protein AAEP93_007916 [Penicillium crustosum]
MRDTPSKFIEILDPKDPSLRMSDSDVRLEDVLADHEATINSRARSSTQSSAKPDKSPSRRNSTSPTPRWKLMCLGLTTLHSTICLKHLFRFGWTMPNTFPAL